MTTNTSTLIRVTILDSLATKLNETPEYIESNYDNHIVTVTDALTERVYEVVDLILDRAESEGMSRNEAESFLASIGLDSRPEPEPEVVEEPAAPKSTEEQVAELTALVSDLAGTVGKLVTLAETKLGATL